MGQYRFVFTVQFASEYALEEYVKFWRETSVVIQKQAGACSTKLHRIDGELILLAIAEWESKEARDVAFAIVERDIESGAFPDDHPIHREDEEFGQVSVIGGGYQIGVVELAK
jgi:hypothetical protein